MSETDLKLDQNEDNIEPSGRGKKLFIQISLSIIVCLLIAGGILIYNLSGTSVGVVYNPSASVRNAGLSYNFTPISVNGKYVSFSYPAALTVMPNQQPVASPILEAFSYKYPDIETWQLNIEVTKLLSNNLISDSGYYERTMKPSEYQESSVIVDGKTYNVMDDVTQPGFNEVAYTLHDGMSGDISLTGDDNLGTANLLKVFNEVLGSFSWNL
jgi:hypothetical protein